MSSGIGRLNQQNLGGLGGENRRSMGGIVSSEVGSVYGGQGGDDALSQFMGHS